MASLTCSTQHVAITSGSKVKVISYSDPRKLMLFELKVKPDETDEKKSGEQKVKKAQEESTPGIDPHVPTGRVLAAVFSSSGAYFAACTDDKELTLWATQPSWTKRWTRTVVKRCMALTFDHSDTALYVADKTGDVYRFDVGEDKTEPTLILGHVSMLLDVVVSPDDIFILTAERDEKIRVSHLPNAYNINAFCLGHTEFISRLSILSSDHLISCGGDSTIRLWDYKEGKELCKTSYDWARPSSQEPDKDKNEATVTCISCSKEHNLIAVTILDHSTVPVYCIMEDKDGHRTFQEVTRVKCKHPPWSLTFDPSGRLLILVPDIEEPLLVMRVERNDDGDIQVIKEQSTEGSTALLAQEVQKDWEFLKCSCNVQNVFKGLHKVPFDNMPDYQQRKQRIENSQSKKGQRRKARRLNKGKKRAIAEDVDNGDAPKRTLLDDGDDEDGEDEEERGDEVEAERMEGVEVHS